MYILCMSVLTTARELRSRHKLRTGRAHHLLSGVLLYWQDRKTGEIMCTGDGEEAAQ